MQKNQKTKPSSQHFLAENCASSEEVEMTLGVIFVIQFHTEFRTACSFFSNPPQEEPDSRRKMAAKVNEKNAFPVRGRLLKTLSKRILF